MIFWWFIGILFCATTQIDATSSHLRNQCDNGQIISADEFCDGDLDCPDGSDETFERCQHTVCPPFAFQCAYGACVRASALCDNKKDCNDNSDETATRCRGATRSYEASVIIKADRTLASFTHQCNNGQLIAAEKFCDGSVDCRDGSDETIERCLHTRCPAFAFQCAYGACINGNAECDHKNDCNDNSDETTIRCQGILESYGISGNCSENEFQCGSGECIQGHNACDGRQHCRDSSDETVELCVSFYCPAFAFRCGYGGCVRGNAVCDGVVDCLDGSDEICGKRPTSPTTTTTTTTESTPIYITRRPTTTSTTKSSIRGRKSCIVGNIPHVKFFNQNMLGEPEIYAGSTVREYTNIRYICEDHYMLAGSTTNMCFKGSWINQLPRCTSNVGTFDEQGPSTDFKNTTEYCSYIPLFGVTFSARCKYNQEEIPCNQSLKSGTLAELSCRPGYQKPNRRVPSRIVCDEHGDWDYSPYRCEAICGRDLSEEVGEENTVQPWNAAVYRFYEQICGGTIISAKIVLSAAHCFWDERKKRRINIENFEVGVGKLFRSYDAQEPNPVHFFTLSEAYISPEYKGRELFYQFDIAILVLNNFIVFTDKIAPICIEWLSVSERAKREQLSGTVGGFGKLENKANRSHQLRTLELNMVDYERCVAKTPPEYRNLITNDKFCVDNQNGESLCDGDSGSGFITSKIIDGKKRYFLAGIISNGLSNQTTCEGNFCTACTDIQSHANTIVEYDLKFRPK